MNVTFKPSVNFKSDTNLISEAVRRIQEPENQRPVSQVPSDKFEREFKDMLDEGRSIDSILKGKYWEKTYNPSTNTVHAKIPNSHDGNEYTVYPDGKVVVTDGWGKNEVEREANKELADYVDQRKTQYEDSIREDLKNEPEIEPKSNDYTNKTYTQAELKEKAEIFYERLNSRKWRKEYLPDNDIIMVRNKRMKDGLEYMIKNDGSVLETGLRDKAVVIIEPSRQSAKTFAKYKRKLDPDAQTSLWMKSKEIVADIWKFFTVSATMAVATAKGLWQGALTGAAVLAGATIIKGAVKVIKNQKTLSEIITHPLQTSGKTGKLLAILAGGAVLAGNIVAGRLKANQKSAVIEHKVDVPHYNG